MAIDTITPGAGAPCSRASAALCRRRRPGARASARGQGTGRAGRRGRRPLRRRDPHPPREQGERIRRPVGQDAHQDGSPRAGAASRSPATARRASASTARATATGVSAPRHRAGGLGRGTLRPGPRRRGNGRRWACRGESSLGRGGLSKGKARPLRPRVVVGEPSGQRPGRARPWFRTSTSGSGCARAVTAGTSWRRRTKVAWRSSPRHPARRRCASSREWCTRHRTVRVGWSTLRSALVQPATLHQGCASRMRRDSAGQPPP